MVAAARADSKTLCSRRLPTPADLARLAAPRLLASRRPIAAMQLAAAARCGSLPAGGLGRRAVPVPTPVRYGGARRSATARRARLVLAQAAAGGNGKAAAADAANMTFSSRGVVVSFRSAWRGA